MPIAVDPTQAAQAAGAKKTSSSADSIVEVEISEYARRTVNPIRRIVDRLKLPAVLPADKPLIPLALGDPTAFIRTDDAVTSAIHDAVRTSEALAYPPAIGYAKAREAIAGRPVYASCRFATDDIVIASGCSGALEMAITVLCSAGDSIAIPRPGFSLYRTIAESRGISVYAYDLDASNGWQVDLDNFNPPANCRAWIVNNPSNPCGSVYSQGHLAAIITRSEQLGVPLIADEIYEDMVFGEGCQYIPLASISSHVPILTCSGIGKRFLVPGWRLGWIAVSAAPDSPVRAGLADLATLILGANAIVQAALPDIFSKTPRGFFARVNRQLGESAAEAMRGLEPLARFLRPVAPRGAMYMMAEIVKGSTHFGSDDVAFCEALLSEELVSALPGSIFGMPGFIRLVFVADASLIADAMRRLDSFLRRHSAE